MTTFMWCVTCHTGYLQLCALWLTQYITVVMCHTGFLRPSALWLTPSVHMSVKCHTGYLQCNHLPYDWHSTYWCQVSHWIPATTWHMTDTAVMYLHCSQLLYQLCMFISSSTTDPLSLHSLIQTIAKYSHKEEKRCPLPACNSQLYDNWSQVGAHLLLHLPTVYQRLMSQAFR